MCVDRFRRHFGGSRFLRFKTTTLKDAHLHLQNVDANKTQITRREKYCLNGVLIALFFLYILLSLLFGTENRLKELSTYFNNDLELIYFVLGILSVLGSTLTFISLPAALKKGHAFNVNQKTRSGKRIADLAKGSPLKFIVWYCLFPILLTIVLLYTAKLFIPFGSVEKQRHVMEAIVPIWGVAVNSINCCWQCVFIVSTERAPIEQVEVSAEPELTENNRPSSDLDC